MHILILKIPHSQAIPSWPAVAWSLIANWAPPPLADHFKHWQLCCSVRLWQQLSYLDGRAPCSSTCCSALTTASPGGDHRPRHPWPPMCNIRLNVGASWQLVFSLIHALCCSETVAQVLRVSQCMNFLCNDFSVHVLFSTVEVAVAVRLIKTPQMNVLYNMSNSCPAWRKITCKMWCCFLRYT